MSDWTPANASFTLSADLRIRRGELLGLWDSNTGNRMVRIVGTPTATTFTVRDLHRWPWLESLRFAWEWYVQWPTRDAITSLRRHFPPRGR